MSTPKLKLGLLLDSYEVPAWAYRSLERIAGADHAEFSLVVLSGSPATRASRVDELRGKRGGLLYRLFNRIDEGLFRGEPDASEPMHAGALLSGVPIITVKPVRAEGSDSFEKADIDRIREHGLDILIRLGFGALRGGILTASGYGVWSYPHGDGRTEGAGPPGFREVVERLPETGSSLRIMSDDPDGGTVLYRSWFFTHPFSPARNRNYYYWASSSFLPRQIERLHRLGEEEFFKETGRRFGGDLDHGDHRPYETPSNMAALTAFARVFARMILRMCQKALYVDQWHLVFDLNGSRPSELGSLRKMMPPADRFWADPHAVRVDGRYYVFVEEYDYKKRKGHIAVIEVDEEGNSKGPVRVLEKPYHLSYPFVFEWEGTYYMVPESAQNRTIELYECVQFPHAWKFKMNLMQNVAAVDTTVFHHEGKWWLFTGIAENEGALPNVELFLFHSKELLTEGWNPHPMNPIVSDVKKARPAGKLFARDGKLYRPSQDCSEMYGHGFDLNEVLLLSESAYLEKKVHSVRPDWDRRVEGTHTFTSEGNLTVIDAFLRRPRLFSN